MMLHQKFAKRRKHCKKREHYKKDQLLNDHWWWESMTNVKEPDKQGIKESSREKEISSDPEAKESIKKPPNPKVKEPWLSTFDNVLGQHTPTIPRARKCEKAECPRLPKALSAPATPTSRSRSSSPVANSRSPSPSSKQSRSPASLTSCWGACSGSRTISKKKMAKSKLRVVQSPKKKKKLVRLPSSPIHLPPKNYSFFHSKYTRVTQLTISIMPPLPMGIPTKSIWRKKNSCAKMERRLDIQSKEIRSKNTSKSS